MPETLGTIIDERKSESSGNASGAIESQERITEPEIIAGYDSFEPDTARIDGDGIRRTKSGKPDRRTRAYRGNAAGTGTEEKPLHLVEKISLEKLLYSLHLMGAEFFKVRELEIDKEEAKKLGDAITEVGKYYALTIDPKHLAFAQLGICLLHIYGPRAIAVKRRLDTQRNNSSPKLVERKPDKVNKPNGAVQNQSVSLAGMSPSDLFNGNGVPFE